MRRKGVGWWTSLYAAPTAWTLVSRSPGQAIWPGFAGTSNVLAGKLYGVPFFGTMAHSFIQSFDDEEEAFAAYAETFPDETALLIDTYDTVAGARHAARVGQVLRQSGHRLRGVRLDSGDLLALSRATREILDAAGLLGTRIYARAGLTNTKSHGWSRPERPSMSSVSARTWA